LATLDVALRKFGYAQISTRPVPVVTSST
jgi:hypothetical protein